MNIEIEELLDFLYFLEEHYQINLIDYSGRTNQHVAQDGDRLTKLLEIYNKTLSYSFKGTFVKKS